MDRTHKDRTNALRYTVDPIGITWIERRGTLMCELLCWYLYKKIIFIMFRTSAGAIFRAVNAYIHKAQKLNQ